MKHLIILRGPSGVGKTTIADKLVKRLGHGTAHVPLDITTDYMIVDHLKVPSKQKIGLMYDNAEKLVNNFLSNGFTVVTDGMFSFKDKRKTRLQRMVQLGKKHDATILVFDLHSNLEILEKRARERKRQDDIDTNYTKVEKRFNIFSQDTFKKGIRIDTSKLEPDESVDEIIKKLI